MKYSEEISRSLSRLQNAIEGRYGDYPLFERQAAVGMCAFDKEKHIIYITYRGSIHSVYEPLSCFCI